LLDLLTKLLVVYTVPFIF